MGKSLLSEDDVQDTLDGIAQSEGSFIKVPEGKTPVYFLKSEFAEGYVHWVDVEGSSVRVVCGGGFEGKGFATEECPICAYVAKLYKKAKAVEGDDEALADKIRKRAGAIRGKYESHFLVAVGELVKEKRGTAKVFVPDFDDAKVGILNMSRTQYESFTSIRNDEKFPFMKGSKDLVNRVIILDKAKREGSKYATTEFIPSKHTSAPPEVEYDEDDFNLEESLEIDEDQILKVVELLDVDGSDMEDDDEDVMVRSSKAKKSKEKRSAKDEEEAFLSEEEDEETSEDDAEEEEADPFEDDFLDDVEDDEDDAPPSPKKPVSSKKKVSKKGKR